MSAQASNHVAPSFVAAWREKEGKGEQEKRSGESAVPTSTRAIVCHDSLQNDGWKLEENVGLRELNEGELLVEMAASGVCHTDTLIGGLPRGAAEIAFYPRVLGHEGSGYVRAVGPGVEVARPGDPVLCSYAFCDACELCKTGCHSNCTDFNALNFGPFHAFHLDGSASSAAGEEKETKETKETEKEEVRGLFFGQSSFAHFSIVRACSIVNVRGVVEDKKELQLLAPLGCGIQTGSGTVINVSGARPTDSICILGLGGVGLSAIMGAKIVGCRQIIGVDRVQSRLDLARELGATHVIDGSKLDEGKTLGDVVRGIADGVGPNIVVDTTGAPVLMDAGMAFVRNRGKYVQAGSPPFDYTLGKVFGFEFMVAGKQWIGAIEGNAYPPDYVPQMIQWYRDGKFPIDKMIKLMPVDDFAQALHEMHDGTTIKPVLTWS